MDAGINRDSAVPFYVQLAGILRDQITAGVLTGLLPSQSALRAEYGVSVGTVRDALEVLRGEGRIRTVPGKGSEAVPVDGGK